MRPNSRLPTSAGHTAGAGKWVPAEAGGALLRWAALVSFLLCQRGGGEGGAISTLKWGTAGRSSGRTQGSREGEGSVSEAGGTLGRLLEGLAAGVGVWARDGCQLAQGGYLRGVSLERGTSERETTLGGRRGFSISLGIEWELSLGLGRV